MVQIIVASFVRVLMRGKKEAATKQPRGLKIVVVGYSSF